MYVMIFDTETTSLDKPFCYDVGYTIIDADSGKAIKSAHYVIEQTWHNLPLFESAYYKEKRPLYVKLMREKKATMRKWGHVTQAMCRDIKQYEITDAYAYNSNFDDKVFAFNCDWFKTINPFDTVAIHDIWGYASQYITNTQAYRDFCETNERFTDSGNYSGNAESVFQYITEDNEFSEDHMGLYDAAIESAILLYCIDNGAGWGQDYKVNKILPRPQKKPFTIKINNQIVYKGEYVKKYVKNDQYNFTT